MKLKIELTVFALILGALIGGFVDIHNSLRIREQKLMVLQSTINAERTIQQYVAAGGENPANTEQANQLIHQMFTSRVTTLGVEFSLRNKTGEMPPMLTVKWDSDNKRFLYSKEQLEEIKELNTIYTSSSEANALLMMLQGLTVG